jgi:phage terminase large subunit-like protein
MIPSPAQVRHWIAIRDEDERRRREHEEAPKYDWFGPPCDCPPEKLADDGSCFQHPRARAKQRPPDWDWDIWLILAGRSFGKTRAGTEWVRDKALTGPPGTRIAMVAAIAKEYRQVLIEGESGILAISPPWFMPKYKKADGELHWPNGAVAYAYTAEEPGSFRGPQFHYALCDELAKWARVDEAWENLQYGLRLGKKYRHRPQTAVTTTPLPIPLIKWMAKNSRLDRDDPARVVAVTTGSSFENAANLPDNVLRRFTEKSKTRLGRQEVFAEILDDAPGALWKSALIEATRVEEAPPDLVRVVIAVDPSVADPELEPEKDTAECGVVVVGLGEDEHAYILDDRSLKGSPRTWGQAVIDAYDEWKADIVVAEVNNGGALVEALLRSIDANVSYKELHASRGKRNRAEPIASLYEEGKVHHVGAFPTLENQMCSWQQGMKSPDRLDALVWGVTEAMLEGMPWTEGEYVFRDYRGPS